jgi:alpha-tubulin suppressor-like RCC1 family protein
MYCWGDNSFGQLGNGTTTNSTMPMAVVGVLSIWQQISAGSTHTCSSTNSGGFFPEGIVDCWGDNSAGQLGNGTTTNSTTPVSPFSNIQLNASSVSAGTLYSCAGTVGGGACWGNNTYGQLGNGATTGSLLPVSISNSSSFDIGISAGADHACALGPPTNATFLNQSALCWGNNSTGQLGDGTMTSSAIPVPVSTALGFYMISAGGHHTCGVYRLANPTLEGAVYCWGDNTYGQIGNSWSMSSSVPVNVAGAP